MSSANMTTVPSGRVTDSAPSTQMIKRSGPRKEPWRTPDATGRVLDASQLTTTCCFLSVR